MKKVILLMFFLFNGCFGSGPNSLIAQIVTGTVADGYTWTGTYWQWTDGSLWTRSFVPGTTYCSSNGCYYTTPGYYSYKYYSPGSQQVTTYSPGNQQVTTYSNSSVDLIAKAVVARDAVRSRITESEYQYQQLIQGVVAANLHLPISNLPALNYSYGAYTKQLVPTNSLLYGQFGINTSTVYGYTPTLAQVINPFNVSLDQHFLNAYQLAQGAQQSSSTVASEFNGLLNTAATQSAQLSGIAARAQAIVAFSKMLDGPPAASNTTYQFQVGPGGKMTASTVPNKELLTQPKELTYVDIWNQSANTRCASCHYGQKGEKKDGNFSLVDYPDMTVDKQLKVIGRLSLLKGEPGHMPKDQDSIPPEEMQAWLQMMSAPNKVKK